MSSLGIREGNLRLILVFLDRLKIVFMFTRWNEIAFYDMQTNESLFRLNETLPSLRSTVNKNTFPTRALGNLTFFTKVRNSISDHDR